MAPAVSKQQFKFFKAMEENPKEAEKKGISTDLAHEYTDTMSKDRWSKLKEKVKPKKEK